MRKIHLSIVILPALFLLAILSVPALADLAGQELSLTSVGLAYEINPDSQGILWVSDYSTGEIWRINPATGSASKYAVGGNPSDARHDGAGMLWWGDAGTGEVGRVPTSGGVARIWQIPGSAGLFGSALDANKNLWVTDISLPALYHVNPSDNTICTYALPDQMMSDYLAISGDFVWLGDNTNRRIARLQISNNNLTTWELGSSSYPEGMALDKLGNPWWADSFSGELGYLDVGLNDVITYTQTLVQHPQMLSLRDGQVWFTDQANFGVLDPALAAKTTTKVIPPQPVILDPSCPVVQPADSAPVQVTTPAGIWSGAVYPALLNQGGWQLYELPSTQSSFPATWGIAALDDIWVVDQGRQKIVRVSLTAPTIRVEKTPSRLTVPETGADVTFTFKVTNSSLNAPVTITSLEDSLYGALDGDADCQVGAQLAVGASCEFSITRWVEGDYSGPPHSNTFTAHAVSGNQVDASAQVSASLSYTNVLPAISVTKSANPSAVPEAGAEVVFTFSVKNISTKEPVTITSLSDSVYSTLAGNADCQVGTVLAVGASCQFFITHQVTVPFGGPDHVNAFTAKAVDNDGSEATGLANATVTFVKIPLYLPLVRK